MPTLGSLKVSFVLALLCLPAAAQVSSEAGTASHDLSKEGVVAEHMKTTVIFQSDGSYTREQNTRVRIQSDAGVQEYAVLRLPYQTSIERIEVLDVRVTKPNGTVVVSPLDSIQDSPSQAFPGASEYSNLHEKHVPVKGLEPGDVLEYSIRWKIEEPLAAGQFWFGHRFWKSAVVLDEQLEFSVPMDRNVKIKSQSIQPTTREEKGRRIYAWKTSNLESQSPEKQNQEQSYNAIRGLLPAADVLISSFQTWEEVGRWYENLQKEKIVPTPEVKAKAEELTKDLPGDDAKVRAIYDYVSLRYHYVGIALGVGRYQPHAASEIFANQYGDCKDKHTLLASLLSAVGIRAYPALISSRVALELDVPMPGQFDHIISIVPQRGTLLWMDTTPEVTAMSYLVTNLRDKPALVIMPDKVTFQTTPAIPPFASEYASTVTGKLDGDGALQAHVEAIYRGDDNELAYRYLFRRVPEAQWKDVARKNFYGARLGGTITSVGASRPENTAEPFKINYDYTLKDFSEGDKHRFLIPLSALNIPEVKDGDLNRTAPLWLGYVGEQVFESRIELPKGWSAAQPVPLNLKEDFAEFHGSTEVMGNLIITKRRLLIKASAISPDQLTSYKTFQKAVSNNHNLYIFLHVPPDRAEGGSATAPARGPARLAELVREARTELPGSSSAEALRAEEDARGSMQTKDYSSVIAALKRAVSIDPNFSRAWIELGGFYAMSADKSSSLGAFQKAIDADPKQVVPYKILAFIYATYRDQDDAIATWKKLQGIVPDDADLAPNLGGLYMHEKRYAEATSLFESAAKMNPSDPYAQLRLGTVRLRTHNTEQGLAVLHKALDIDSGPEMLNDVAYEMAEADTNLADALAYSQRSVKEIEELSQKTDLENIQKADLQLPLKIAAYWDTLGWIYFKMGDLARAENYLNSAWHVGEGGLMGDHLGQVYEREQNLPAALHMYNLALEANPRLEETPSRMRNLAHVTLPKNRVGAKEELNQMRTVKLPTITKESVSADFDLLFAGSGGVNKAHFVRGSELLHNATQTLEKAVFEEPFPPNSTAHLLRRGALSCSVNGCTFVLYAPAVAASGVQN